MDIYNSLQISWSYFIHKKRLLKKKQQLQPDKQILQTQSLSHLTQEKPKAKKINVLKTIFFLQLSLQTR